jgi:small-conductance mechanosensitive channel
MSKFFGNYHIGMNGSAWDWLVAIGAAALGVVVALLVHKVIYRLLMRLAQRSHGHTDDIVLAHLRAPTRWAMVALGLVLAARETPLLAGIWEKVAGFAMPALIGWIALAAFKAFVEASCAGSDGEALDDLDTRRKRTRLAIFSRIATFVIVFVTVGLMLFSIPGVRQIGVTLMASAGIGALAVGAAAQPALKSLIAGMQMALTEPISIGDTVKVGNDAGTVEDIRTSFVVVRTWDQRRLVVPTSKFLEDTFENWTRGGAALFGPTVLQFDPLADIGALRAEFDRLVEQHPRWDQRKKELKVTGLTKDYSEVRMVVSADSSGDLFAVRTDVLEGLLAFIRERQPDAISHARSYSAEDAQA